MSTPKKPSEESGFDTPSDDASLDRKPGVVVVPNHARIVDISKGFTNDETLTDILSATEDQPADTGKDAA